MEKFFYKNLTKLSIFLRSIFFRIVLQKKEKREKSHYQNSIKPLREKKNNNSSQELEKWRKRKELDYNCVIKAWVECREKKF